MGNTRRAPSVRHVVLADEDPAAVAVITATLRADGHAVFPAYDALSAVELATFLSPCDLVISNTRVNGAPGVDLIVHLRSKYPALPILYLANDGRSTPELERRLPADVPVLREPFTPDRIRAAVGALIGDRPPREAEVM